jgi:type IV pilus assembly protein PilC
MKFNYQARDKDGTVQSGNVEASSRDAALSLLQRSKLFVTFLEEAKSTPFYAKKIQIFGKTGKKDVVNFSRQLSLMFQSKIPLVEALHALADQTKSVDFKEKILSLADTVEGGSPFSQALSRYPRLFSSFYVSMIKSGEASGTLSESLDYLAEHLEREYHLFAKIKGALTYPALILVMVLGVLAMMMFFIVPNIAKVLLESEQELPMITKVIIGLSDFSRSWGWILLLIVPGVILFFLRYLKTPEGKESWDKFLLKIPLIGPFLRMIYVSRFAENLSTLVTGGIPIVQAIDITAEIVGNSNYRAIVLQLKEDVKRGKKISQCLALYPKEFPSMLTQMISVGERTGTLDKSLMNAVNFYQKEIERSTDSLLSILEPLLIVFLSVIVAGLMAAMLLPMYKMSSAV